MYRGEKKVAKLQPGRAKAEKLSRARKKYLATTHKNFFSAL